MSKKESTNKYELSDEFHDDDKLNHFTHYDYLLQVIENGQPSAFKEHLGLMSNKALVKFREMMPYSKLYRSIVSDSILERMK